MMDTNQTGAADSADDLPGDCLDPFDPSSVPHWNSTDLLRGQREALIVHGGEVYRLRCTRNGKLILQK